MKRIFMLTFIFFVFNGCGFFTESYPAWTVSSIAQDDVPRLVMKSFQSKYPDVKIIKIERSILESRLSGKPKLYRFTFESEKEKEGIIILDDKGKPSNLDFWFDSPRKSEH